MTMPTMQPPRPAHSQRRRAADVQFLHEYQDAPNRHRRRWIAGGAAGAIAVATGATIAATHSHAPQQPTNRGMVACYAVATLDSGPDVMYYTSMGGADDQVPYALELCASGWSNGFLHLDKPHVTTDPNAKVPPGGFPVPPLTVCVRKDGMAAVYPGDDSVCRQLGLPPVSDDPPPPELLERPHVRSTKAPAPSADK